MTGRAALYVLCGYVAMLVEGALAFVLPAPRFLLAVPELSLAVVTYLGLAGRGSATQLVVSAMAVGYLRDLLLGAPRGVETLAFVLCALCARAMHGRVFAERWGQLAAVAVAMSLVHAFLVVVLGAGDAPLAGSLRPIPGLLLSALWVGPLMLRGLRRLDARIVPEQRAIRMDGDFGERLAMSPAGSRDARRARAQRPFLWVQVITGAVFLLLVVRLWHLQVMLGDHYFRRSNDNFVKEIELPSSRGVILDKKRRTLADNRASYDLYLTPRFATEESINRLGRFLHLDEATLIQLRARVAQKKGADRYKQILAVRDVSRDELALVEGELADLPGLQVEAQTERAYPNGSIGSHTLGYLNEISAEELAQHRQDGYRAGDLIGRAGLERQWESFLRGKDGHERIIVDARGRKKTAEEVPDLTALLGADSRLDPQPGLNLVTTLDLDLMGIVDKALRRHRAAAAVVVDVETGYLLAMGSQPTIDPNKLTHGLTHEELERLTSDVYRPLIDKTVRENYFPGSTYKIVPTLAALESGHDLYERIPCHGSLSYGKRTFHCVETHGPLNLSQALSQSCNVYYYVLGDRLGIDRMAEIATQLGFGVGTGLGLNGEAAGMVPTVEDYKKQGPFQKGMILNTAIGQGSVKLTILQVAMAYAAIANGGYLYMPQVVSAVETQDGKIVQAFPARLRRKLPFSGEHLALIRRALYDAIYDMKGTSFAARVPGFEVAGKTGTAQVKNGRRKANEGDDDADHAWFASFAPYDHPKIAVVVLVEHGGFGAKAATPTAMEIYRGWYDKVAPEARPASWRPDAVVVRPGARRAAPTQELD